MISQFNCNFNGPNLRNETWHRQSAKSVGNLKESPTPSQNDMNVGSQTASNWAVIFTRYPNILRSLHCQASQTRDQQTELNQTLPHGRGPPPHNNLGPANCGPIFDDFATQLISGKECDIVNWASALETRGGVLRDLRTIWTFVDKQLKLDRRFLHTLQKFCIFCNFTAILTAYTFRTKYE